MREPTYSPSEGGTRYQSDNLVVALQLAAAGIPIFPALVTWNAQTGKLDKKPAIQGWRTKATTDAAQICAWWEKFSTAVPGIELERAGLVVLDPDRHPGAPDGVAAFKQLRAEQEPIPPTPVTRTASNGVHIFLAQPAGNPLGNGRGDLPAGIDVRGAGGWVVAPGAMTEWGGWRSAPTAPLLTVAYATGTIPVIPTWLATILRTPPIQSATEPPSSPFTTTAGNTRTRRVEAWAAAALEGSVAALEEVRPGGRNNMANAVAYRLGRIAARGWIDATDIAHRLFAACITNGLVHDDGGPSVHKTILSGITAGLTRPCSDLRERE
jgi:hypothetical protein